ncbi:MAG TPA: alpha/beta fold hydrolase [Bacillota bacterium]|nr:alpha/beta fold hydrolase [Bacillota bacterium]HOL10148.1 alpha/beta fold hydrolase [Bacillota bacterium]HPO97917.1 alpha/beta fold hydrolase [Bacillota bacterium]
MDNFKNFDHDPQYQQAKAEGGGACFDLALKLAAAEYHHPECEAVAASDLKRSFCFHHNQRADTAVLLIHGWTGCPFEMNELGQYLYQKGSNVFGVRLAGHGTNVQDFAKYGREDWKASVVDGLKIVSLLGEQVIVVGESMGASLATLIAVEYSALIAKLVLCAPCFRIRDWKAEFATFKLVQRLIPEVDFGESPEQVRGYWYSKVPIGGVAELIRVVRQARKTGSKIKTPILVIQSLTDKMVKPEGAVAYYRSLKQLSESEKHLKIFEDGHHNLTSVLNPHKDDVFRWIGEFISG